MKLFSVFMLTFITLIFSTISYAEVKVSISQDIVNIGDPVEINILITNVNQNIIIPNIKDKYQEDLRLVFSDIIKISDTDTQIIFKIVPIQTGLFMNIFTESNVGVIPDFKIRVDSLLTDNMTDVVAIKGLKSWEPEISYLKYYIIASVVFILLILLGLYFKFRKPKENEVHIDTALELFEKLKSSSSDENKEYFLQLSLIIRKYISEITNKSVESTSEEILLGIDDASIFILASPILLKADRVKFAGEEIFQEDISQALQNTEQLIVSTNEVKN